MNVFELATQFNQLQALLEAGEVDPTQLEAELASIDGSLDYKLENIGFLIKNREAAIAGMEAALKALDTRKSATEAEVDRLKALALSLMTATNKKKVEGQYLVLGRQNNAPSVKIAEGATFPAQYMRTPDPVPPPVAVPDKKKIAEDLKLGVIIEGATLVTTQRLTIK